MRRPRDLRPEERELWHRVTAHARPLHPENQARRQTADHPKKTPPASPEHRPAPAAKTRPHPSAPDHPQPLRMDAGRHRDLLRGKMAPEARIDLHGMTLTEAHPALIGFILASQAQGRRLVLVITGKGRGGAGVERTGALRHQVPHWLVHPPLGMVVQQIVPAHRRHGGEGALYVYLRRRTP